VKFHRFTRIVITLLCIFLSLLSVLPV